MAECRSCAAVLPENAKYCPNCGKYTGKTCVEEFEVRSDELIRKVKEIFHKGNVTKLIVESVEGKPLLEIPVTAGVVGVLVAPWLAALGVIAAIVTNCKIKVEKKE